MKNKKYMGLGFIKAIILIFSLFFIEMFWLGFSDSKFLSEDEIVCGILIIILLFIVFLTLWRTKINYKFLFGKINNLPKKMIVLDSLFYFTLNIVITIILLNFSPSFYQAVKNLDISPTYPSLDLFTVVVIAPLLEEIIFRGLIFNIISEKFNTKIGILISGLLFALAHGGDKAWIFVLSGSCFYFSYLYIKTKSLWASLVFHIINNTLTEGGIFDSIDEKYLINLNKLELLFLVIIFIALYIFAIKKFIKMWLYPKEKINAYKLNENQLFKK